MRKQIRKLTKRLTRPLENEKGMATIETIPLIIVFVVLLCYEFGVFGVIHTGIMQSMSARAYAFETFRNRANVTYFRDTSGRGFREFKNVGNRTHGIASEARTDADTTDGIAAERPLRVGIPMAADEASRRDLERHNTKSFNEPGLQSGKRNERIEISPVWIKVQYGMCLNARCGG